jgi:hypothetical protein
LSGFFVLIPDVPELVVSGVDLKMYRSELRTLWARTERIIKSSTTPESVRPELVEACTELAEVGDKNFFEYVNMAPENIVWNVIGKQ